MKNDYKILEATDPTGQKLVQLTCSRFSGIIYSYGKVWFEELDDSLKLNFDYEVYESAGIEYDSAELEQQLGDILQDLIYEGIEKNSLTYTGGIDENRTEDSDESDLR